MTRPNTRPKTQLPRRGTQAYATLHAREVAKRWDVPVVVVRRGADFFCAVAGAALPDGDRVGRAVAGGRMFVYDGTAATPERAMSGAQLRVISRA